MLLLNAMLASGCEAIQNNTYVYIANGCPVCMRSLLDKKPLGECTQLMKS